MSGWCGNPSEGSHARCAGGSAYNPDKEFVPCPCACHLGAEVYECGNCGADLREAPLWPSDEEEVYVHIDSHDGRSLGEECLR